MMAKVGTPARAMIPFAVAMLWALVPATESGNARWWMAAECRRAGAAVRKLSAVCWFRHSASCWCSGLAPAL